MTSTSARDSIPHCVGPSVGWSVTLCFFGVFRAVFASLLLPNRTRLILPCIRPCFLVAYTGLYTPLCRSVGRLVGRSVGPSVTHLFFRRFSGSFRITAPAQSHPTDSAVYTALFLCCITILYPFSPFQLQEDQRVFHQQPCFRRS